MLYFHHATLNKGSYFYDIERKSASCGAECARTAPIWDRRARLLCLPGQWRNSVHLPRVCRPYEPGEDKESYFSIFPPRVLSGAQDKNLIDLSFQTSQVADSDEHRLLMALRDSGLDDEQALENILSNGHRRAYLGGPLSDPPCPRALRRALKAKDGAHLEDGSQVFTYVLCAICPVKPGRPPFAITRRKRNFTIRAGPTPSAHPSLAFLFPAFDGRRTNLYNCLYYSHSLANNHPELGAALFKLEPPEPAEAQKESFGELLSQSLRMRAACRFGAEGARAAAAEY